MENVQSLPVRSGWTFLNTRSPGDWLYVLALIAGAAYAMVQYGAYMDEYEKAILVLSVPTFGWLGWRWSPIRSLLAAVAVVSLLAISMYQSDLGRAEDVFLLKYFVSSQSAIMWMSVLFFLATFCYWAGLLSGSSFAGSSGTVLTWCAVLLGTSGLLVRWYESYLLGPDIGHIPVSNLYEVFVLFSVMTALFYLYYEQRYATKHLGGFVMVVISAAVGFLLWYTFEREAHEIQPLVPALQSWWMKIHVPANFIGYGTFSLAAMTGFAYLIKNSASAGSQKGASALWAAALALALLLALEAVVFRKSGSSVFWLAYFAVFATIFGAMVAARHAIAARLPAVEILEDLMYRSIAVGFAFFTIATILGALWAAEAWGAYWSWDPKETWALIVWLNYAAWLHMRQMKGLRGAPMAWWALAGLLVTTFAFLGVNMFLSGLHSYGQL